MQCDDGDVRVLTGEASGPIEVCFNKTWAKVCFDEWSDVDATVACRQLGYDSGKIIVMKCHCKPLHVLSAFVEHNSLCTLNVIF